MAPLVPSLACIDNAGIGLSFTLSYLVAFVFGIPAIIVLKKIRQESHTAYAIIGFTLGASYLLIV